MMTRRTFTTSAIAFGAVALTATPAFAHAALKSSVPAADSTVKAPTQISIYFTEAIEPKFSTIKLANSAGAIVSKEAAVIDPRDAKHLTLALPKGLPAGVYTVQWTSSAADDGHKLSRTYNFTIA